MSYQIVDSADGAQVGALSTSKVGFYGYVPVPQSTSPSAGSPINAATGGLVKTFGYYYTGTTTVPANSTSEFSLTVTGVLATDVILAVNPPVTPQAGLQVMGARVTAANTIKLMYANMTAATMTPTQNQLYNFVVESGLPINAVTFSAASIAATTSAEQIITVAPTQPTFTSFINAAGQVTDIKVVTGGSGLAVPPVLTIAEGSSMNNIASGTAAGLGQASAPQGVGATAVAIVQGGVCIGVQITNPGSGYTTAPVVTSSGGHGIEPGMAVNVAFNGNAANGTAWTFAGGYAISHARVVASGQVAVSFVNVTAAAVTPTASTVYTVAAYNTIPAVSNKVVYAVPAGAGIVSVTQSSSTEHTVTCNSILASDSVLGFTQSALDGAIIYYNARVSGAAAVQVAYNNIITNAWVTPTTTITYTLTVQKQFPTAPLAVFSTYLTPVSVAASTSAEQTFTLPTGTLPYITTASTVIISPTQALQPGLAMTARVSAANTLAVQFVNLSTSIITPYAGTYTIGSYQQVGPANAATGGAGMAMEDASGSIMSLMNSYRASQLALSNNGLIRGY